MPQLLANNASALLIGSISAVATTLSVEPARADLFPIGNTTNFATPLDWFKATIEDSSGNIEIVRVGVRAAASGVMSTLLRGQDGTTARAFVAGSVVELRVTAADIQNAIGATASTIPNTPAGNIAATTVQAAINELDAEKIDAGSIQAQSATAVTTAGTSTAYVIATLPVQPSLEARQRYRIKLHTPNGVAPTLARDGLAAVAFKVYSSAGGKVAPAAAALPTLFDAEYDGVDYVVLNQLPGNFAASGANTDITSLSGLTTAISIAQGGVHGNCLLEYVSTTQIRLKPQNGNRLTVNGVSCTVPDAPLTLAATGLQPVFASTNRAITSNVATRTHAALAAALPVGSQILVLDSGGAEAYNGLKTVTASTTTTTSYAAVAANEGTTADTGSITPIYNTYAVATAGAISSIEASLTARATSTAASNKGVEIKTGDETRTFVGTFRIAAGPVFANNVQSWFNGRPPRREYFSVLANRAINTSYPNSTLQDMEVLLAGTASSTNYVLQITVDGVVRANSSHNDGSSGAQVFLNVTVPPGSSYQVTSSTPALWNELRLP